MSLLERKWTWSRPVLFEWRLVLTCLILSGIGIALIYSATTPMGDIGRKLVIKQITWCSLGLVLMAAFVLLDYHWLESWAVWIYLIMVLALLAVWGFGKVTAGSRRWFEIGFMRLQPSEFAKVALVIFLAKYFHDRPLGSVSGLLNLTRPLMLTLLPAALVLVQPDLGTAGVIFLVGASMILFAAVNTRGLLRIGGLTVIAIPILILAGDRFLMDYQKRRLLTFLNPDYDPLGAGYHIIQSQIAIGSGGILGKGYLQGTQNQLMFLPVKHTDFIFSILAEEWGFVGCSVVLLLFCGLFLRGLAISNEARDNFGTHLAFGATALIFWHVVINVGMVTGLLPVVGVPLSFLSYGGSSLLASFLAVSLIVNVSMRRFSY
jgi:rod shape determining protein RodA